MKLTAQVIAEEATFRAFMNCYLREIDSGTQLNNKEIYDRKVSSNEIVDALEINLDASGTKALIEVSYRSLVGCHHFGQAYILAVDKETEKYRIDWKEIDKISLLKIFIREIYLSRTASVEKSSDYFNNLKKNELELEVRLLESYQLMMNYLEAREGDPCLDEINFIFSEQSCLFGHWLHPTPKSRQGMAFWQQSSYSPELKGKFKLHYFSVDNSLIKQGGSLEREPSEIFKMDLGDIEGFQLSENHSIVPAHPLQAQFLLLQPWVQSLISEGKITNLGERGDLATATSSVRTLFKDNSCWMYKFSIPVKITNSLRCNKLNELETGMAIERYMKSCGFIERHPNFSIIDDPAFLTVVKPGDEKTESGFEVLLRRNPFMGAKGEGICTLLSLVQAPLPGKDGRLENSLIKKIIQKISNREGRSYQSVAIDWFDKYFKCAIESLILLYDEEGVALEAHQQNSLLDLSNGYPSRYFYRDNQGFYLSKSYREKLQVVADELTMSDIFYDDIVIFEAMSYYLFINQLFSVIYRLGADSLVDEKILIDYVRSALTNLKGKLKGIGANFIDHLISNDTISYKANLLARVRDIDELHLGMERAVYASLKNPLFNANDINVENLPEHEVGCHVA